MDQDQYLSSYDYQLPPQCIAQSPAVPRDHSRLLVVKDQFTVNHEHFYDLGNYLNSGDLLVLNDTKVMPARLHGKKDNGVAVEILLLTECRENQWIALVKPGKRLKLGAKVKFTARDGEKPDLWATILQRDEATGGRLLEFALEPGQRLWDVLPDYGEIPFPPYIGDRQATDDQYQTIYAEKLGAVAAPTAGLHFTEELFTKLTQQGVQTTKVTLHVGIGTFRPVETENILNHVMHQEWIDVPPTAVEAIAQTKANGGRIFAVGTTVVRCLEGMAQECNFPSQPLQPFRGQTDLFIYPGYQWRLVEGLITNFHLPKSSLLMLVSALISRPRLMAIYETAIAKGYRFYSFGDAMVILPEACQGRETAEKS
ncbi:MULTISPECIES: tRNA preQ1(34) S-adenosylmethionine ribosyltransferase-isomerase QueA [unclassified Synechocystis]|uniref:tRNA preQ1(34) S-adenosylmethionine ribosyltransferase-isomerase QueA n=1 Tax=unclassified Synechocystis TaxID=2640012 RepID=UPI00048F6B0B|nr:MULTISPECIES: tRNA preQ1(34) S-adenosylmethionine ribosyltransferase-isomerase QueA [unclassified Synechocystis]MCT0254402.1 tRNA preQ1(34) S-adenosylmethionine ribosyltransferase-isomerase QueA [Synechocystis sp. CS-94]